MNPKWKEKKDAKNDIVQESKTFIRWINIMLKETSQTVNNLESDLQDGTVLLDLFICLTNKTFPVNSLNIDPDQSQTPIDRINTIIDCMKAENVDFYEDIDPQNIVDGDVQSILNLLWSLIAHFAIALTALENSNSMNLTSSFDSSKDRLLRWIQHKIPKLSIQNFSTDWRNGTAIGALINAIAPGLCSDWNSWNVTNYLKNTQDAMYLARDWLDIQMFILPEELISGKVTEKALLTYLCQFPTAKLRSGAPLRAKYISNRISAYGPGISPIGPVAQAPANFTVETAAAGKGSIDVLIRGPSGATEKADVRFNHDEKLSYSVSYIPKTAGDYKVYVTFLGKDIPNSPFSVQVAENSVGDISKVRSFGPGLQSDGNYCGKTTFFEIIADDTSSGVPEVIILDPAGHKTTVPVKVRQIETNRWRCEYVSNLIGLHSVNIFFAGIPIKNSPFGVKIAPLCDSRKVRVRGRGIQAKGIRNGDDAVFFIHTTGAGIGTPEVKIVGPGGINQNVDIKHVKDDLYECHYYPTKEGRYVIMVKYGKFGDVPKAPFEVIVGPRSQSSIIAYGPGLFGGVVGYAAAFVVEMNGETGALGFSIAGPSQAEIECHDNGDGSALVRYLPTVAGEYAIHILCDNEDICKSPFIAQILTKSNFRPDIVKCYGAGIQSHGVILGCSTEFKIDTNQANTADLQIKIQDTLGNCLPFTTTRSKETGITHCTYIPKTTLPHVVEVNYGGVAAAQSPYRIYVSVPPNVNKLKVFGDWFETKTKLNVPNNFKIDASAVDVAELNVYLIHEESGEKVPVNVLLEDTIYTIDLIVKKPGNYLTKIYYGGIPLSMKQKVYVPPLSNKHIPNEVHQSAALPEKVKVFGPAFAGYRLKAGEATHFNIDVSEAGTGIVAVCIFNMHGIPVDNVFIVNKGGGLYTVNFIPPNEKSIVITVKFAHQHVSSSKKKFRFNSPFLLTIDPIKEETPSDIERPQSSRKSDISLVIEDSTKNGNQDSNGHSTRSSTNDTSTNTFEQYGCIYFSKLPVSQPIDEIKAEVKMPSGKIDLPIIEDNRDGTIRVQYDPKEEGVHELVLTHNGVPVEGSPYKFHVDSITSGCITAYGPGLASGKCGEPCNFSISTKGAGAPLLSLSVEGPSKAKVSYTDNKDGTISVSFLPTEPGDYNVSVRFGDKHITGSPFLCKVDGDVKKRNQISISSSSQVTLPGVLTDADLRSLNAIIMTPSGLEEPCFLKRLPSGNIGVSFTPRETGEHVVSIKRLGQQIKNSPFKITVSEREVGDAKKVKVFGALAEAKTQTDNVFTIDTRDAGYGGLSLSIEGPSKAQIKCLDQVDGTLQIVYKPTEPGNYILNLKFADHHVEGSPFNITVSGEGSNRQRENIQQQTSAVPSNDVGSKCKLTFKMPGITSFDLAAAVTSPKGVTQDAEVQEIEDGIYAVNFVPKVEGVHVISVKYTDLDIPGSPFQFTVGPFGDSGSHLVKAGGSGLEFGEVGVPAEFNIWTREAGEGRIAISIEGPSKAEINFKDRKDGSCNVAYTVTEPGQYHIGLKFNERHIPNSPYIVRISPPAADAHKVEIAQFPQGVIQTNTPSQFLVRKNGAKGDIDAKIVSPLNNEDDCFVQNIDSEETSIRFYPREEGIHSIHVKLNGVHIPGSPFRIKVGKDAADASIVRAEGPGLKDVVTGQKTFFTINTCDAGVGTLSVTLDGPAKVSLDCTETDSGYKARYTPFLPGDYYASVKYNGIHIVGSPFKITCKGKNLVEEGAQESTNVSVQTIAKNSKNKNGPALPIFNADASKVTIKGMGIKKAFIGKQNQFTVNASEAGHSILFVGLYNPKGPCEEVQVKHTGKNTFTVNYYIRERGEYTLLVMWGENHIPGSPFAVEVPTK